ncbi:MAG: glycosyltransferase family 2 protein, partial [Nanoarchaeota archaeon]
MRNKKTLFQYPKSKRVYSISVIVPAFNKEDTIENTVKAVLKSDYKGLKEVIVVDDGSSDNTLKLARQLAEENKKVRVFTKENKGSKADALNFGLEKARGELVGVVDADSYIREDALTKLAAYFDDDKVGAVTCPILARNCNKFIEKLQAVEYRIIAFTRKLLDYVDAIYVTPGPLALYRKSVVREIGGFDVKNMTEDIEATW